MAFERGQTVEILSQEKGFEGSFFPAIIISKVSENNYIVQYSTLHAGQHEGYDDEFRPQREFCKETEIRPEPPHVSVSEFALKHKVDAYYNDGWWVGTVIECVHHEGDVEKKYLVYFKKFDEKTFFKFEDLRVHQDWSRGQWSIPKKVGRPVGSIRKLAKIKDDENLYVLACRLEKN
ncbi:hypothetical protein LIER_41602 [Lithospermum erythrorhizon]|uniref:Agenet domain-containing protein n=1 Tax=Lithospermum erythrorhizon TaxID=34254 RepID=A0AAV3RF82_LITER